MLLTNSYVFLLLDKEIEVEEECYEKTNKSIEDYILHIFPDLKRVDIDAGLYKKTYDCSVNYKEYNYKVTFVLNCVLDIRYLDISVEGKSKVNIIKCLSYIQQLLLQSGLKEQYIAIITYDSISEYYCDKLYKKLNMLERSLRKLFFNVYILNFGKDYYETGIDSRLRNETKGRVKQDKSQYADIRKNYNVNSKTAIAIQGIQNFFYSLEFSEIEKLLFTPNWTEFDEKEKEKFLKKHNDLSKLTDKELRDAISQFSPKSDFDRFFSDKFPTSEVKELIEKIHNYRNIIAHVKIINENDYKVCNQLMTKLNYLINNAIKTTEDKDFYERNFENIHRSIQIVVEKIEYISKKFQNYFQSENYKRIKKISDEIEKSRSVKLSSLISEMKKTTSPQIIKSSTVIDSLMSNFNQTNLQILLATENNYSRYIASMLDCKNQISDISSSDDEKK